MNKQSWANSDGFRAQWWIGTWLPLSQKSLQRPTKKPWQTTKGHKPCLSLGQQQVFLPGRWTSYMEIDGILGALLVQLDRGFLAVVWRIPGPHLLYSIGSLLTSDSPKLGRIKATLCVCLSVCPVISVMWYWCNLLQYYLCISIIFCKCVYWWGFWWLMAAVIFQTGWICWMYCCRGENRLAGWEYRPVANNTNRCFLRMVVSTDIKVRTYVLLLNV